MSMAKSGNLHEARLALFEHLKGELMILMGVIPSEIESKEDLLRQMEEIGDVAQAVLEALNIEIVEIKEGKIHAVIDVGEID